MPEDETESVVNRQSVIKTVGLGVLAVGGAGVSSGRGNRGGPPEKRGARGGGPPTDSGHGERTIT